MVHIELRWEYKERTYYVNGEVGRTTNHWDPANLCVCILQGGTLETFRITQWYWMEDRPALLHFSLAYVVCIVLSRADSTKRQGAFLFELDGRCSARGEFHPTAPLLASISISGYAVTWRQGLALKRLNTGRLSVKIALRSDIST